MKNKKLLVFIPALLLTLGLASCQKKPGGESKPVDTSDSAQDETKVESVSLDKETLELGIGNSATLRATVTPANATNTNVSWSTSDAAVAEVTQLGKVTAKGEGQATITVTTEDGGKTASCLVTVVAAIHGTVETDPLSPAEAIEIAEALEDGAKTDEVYYIKGTVSAIREAYSSYGNMSLDFAVGEKVFVGYRLAVEAEVAAIIGKNSEVLFSGQITKYVSSSGAVTLETASGTGTVISATQGDIATGHGYAQDDPFTADEALAQAMTLDNGAKEDSVSYTKGIVASIDDPYGSFGNITFTFVTTEGTFTAYRAGLAADLIVEEKVSCKVYVGSEVLVSGQLMHYHKDATETAEAQDKYQIAQGGTVLTATGGEQGGGEETPEPAVVNATMAEVWADESGNGAKKFHVENVKLNAFATNKGVATDTASQYGNALLGENGEYFAYGMTATATALTWNKTAAKYEFVNPKDFTTNETTKVLVAGAVLDLDVIRADYGETKEVTCVITSVKSNGGEGGGGETPVETPEPAAVNATMAEVWADESGNGAKKFVVKDVKLFAFATNKGVATENAGQYGNALLGENGEYFAYGMTATATALAWNGTSAKYEFTNPRDFTTNETTKALAAGAVLDLEVIRADYTKDNNTTKEVVCIITNVKDAGGQGGEGGGEQPPVDESTLTLDFSGNLINDLKAKADVTKDEAYEATLGGLKYTVINAYGSTGYQGGPNYLMMNAKGYGSRAFFGNKDALAKNIKSIEIFTTTGAAADPKYSVVTSASALTEATPVETPTVIDKGSSHKFEFTDGNPYFGITCETNKNGQILKIVITFVEE